MIRQDGFVYKHLFSRKESERLKNFNHNGHRYHYSPEDAFLLKWYPSQRIDWRSPLAMITWARVSRVKGLLVYKEPKGSPNWDYKLGEEIPIEPLKGEITKELVNAETVCGNIIDPVTFKKLALSPVYRRLINKTSFGTPNVILYVLLGGIVVVIALFLMTKVGL